MSESIIPADLPSLVRSLQARLAVVERRNTLSAVVGGSTGLRRMRWGSTTLAIPTGVSMITIPLDVPWTNSHDSFVCSIWATAGGSVLRNNQARPLSVSQGQVQVETNTAQNVNLTWISVGA